MLIVVLAVVRAMVTFSISSMAVTRRPLLIVALDHRRRRPWAFPGESAMSTKLNVAKMMLAMKHPQHASYSSETKFNERMCGINKMALDLHRNAVAAVLLLLFF